MFKKYVLIFFILCIAFLAYSQEIEAVQTETAQSEESSNNISTDGDLGLSLGINLEMNMNSPTAYAMGYGLNAGYLLPEFLPIGFASVQLKFLFSTTYSHTNSLEIAPAFRWYFWKLQEIPDSGLYAEFEMGATIVWGAELTKGLFLSGLNAGYRYYFDEVFIDAYLRFGYPHLWGLGLSAGYRF